VTVTSLLVTVTMRSRLAHQNCAISYLLSSGGWRFHGVSLEGLHYHRNFIFKVVATLYRSIANMPKNSAGQDKKVNAAVRFLQTTIGVVA